MAGDQNDVAARFLAGDRNMTWWMIIILAGEEYLRVDVIPFPTSC